MPDDDERTGDLQAEVVALYEHLGINPVHADGRECRVRYGWCFTHMVSMRAEPACFPTPSLTGTVTATPREEYL